MVRLICFKLGTKNSRQQATKEISFGRHLVRDDMVSTGLQQARGVYITLSGLTRFSARADVIERVMYMVLRRAMTSRWVANILNR